MFYDQVIFLTFKENLFISSFFISIHSHCDFKSPNEYEKLASAYV